MRVFELAKQLNKTSKELMADLAKQGTVLKNHMSTIDEDQVEALIRKYAPKKDSSSDPVAPRRGHVLIKKRADAPVEVAPAEPVMPPGAPEPVMMSPSPAPPARSAPDVFRPHAPVVVPQPPMPVFVKPQAAVAPPPAAAAPPRSPVAASDVSAKEREKEREKEKDKLKSKLKKGVKREKEAVAPVQLQQDALVWQDFKPLHRRDERLRAQMKKAHHPSSGLDATKPRKKTVKLHAGLTVKDLADLLGVKATQVIGQLLSMGTPSTINQSVDLDAAVLVAEHFGVKAEGVADRTEEEMIETSPDDPTLRTTRPPVVTIMGHVDHGKTSLLDAIRTTKVTEQEAGGITQHIGAYTVSVGGKSVTFLDTPGHEAFTSMRARGAKVTDLVVLVVAADDGVMPQTVEAINHAKAADVPIIVAINKIDKPDAQLDRIKNQLSEHGLISEAWGGTTIFVEVSAKKKIGLDTLLEMILLQADVLELTSNADRPAVGAIIEARLDKGRGPMATVLVQQGTLRVGDLFVTGNQAGKVRALLDDLGRRTAEAGPSMPVEVIGLEGVPQAGDVFQVVKDDRTAKEIVAARLEKGRAVPQAQPRKMTLEDLYGKISAGATKELTIVLKADVQGSAEALKHSLEKLSTDQVRLRVLHEGIGGITESDVLLAAASNAVVIGFNVRPESKAQAVAERETVDIRTYRIIYEAVDDVRAAMEGLLDPTFKEQSLGRAEVRQVFMVPRAGAIAGSYVLQGVISRASTGARVIRDGIVVYQGKLGSLRRFKDDVREVQTEYECGIGIENFNDLKVGDIIEVFSMEKIAGKLA
ncbi:MAG: translation initiation factor IF-2 [Nitrospiria bacterium]